VTLNGVKVAELGINETVILDPLIGENVIKLQPFGYLTSPHDGASKTFTMEEGQKRFFISGAEIYNLYKGPDALRNWTRRLAYRPAVAELGQAAFFARMGIRTSPPLK
jgi:hypothetical protein